MPRAAAVSPTVALTARLRRGGPAGRASRAARRALAHLRLVALEALGLPDLKGAADADKGCGLGDAGMLGEPRRQHHPPFAVEGQLLRVGEDRRDGVAFVGEFGQAVDALAQQFAGGRCRCPRAPRNLTAGKTTMPAKLCPASACAKARRDGDAALAVDLVEERGKEQRHPAGPRPRPMTSARSAPPAPPSPPLAPLVHGTEWDTMG